MGGLIAIRRAGPRLGAGLGAGRCSAWLALVPFARYEAGHPEPMVDVRLLATPGQWPVQLTAFLFGMSVLGAQIPLSTFARTDPDTAGYGLGADASFVSTLIGVYVVFLAIGAFTLPLTSRLLGPRGALVLGALLVALGYGLWLPFHDSTGQALVNMAVAGVGSGALVAALPATAAAAAPPDRTGFATGMTNATKTVGGAIASSIFAICLASTGSIKDPVKGHAPLSGYLTVWAICAAAALLAAVALLLMPTQATSRPVEGRRLTSSLGALYFWRHAGERGRAGGPTRSSRRPAVARRRTGKAAAAARIAQQQTWVDLQVRQAMERGDFDDLPGAGKPIEDLGEHHDPELVAQEAGRARAHRGAAAEPGAAQGGRRARRRPRQAQHRGARYAATSTDFNERVVAARYRPPEGPPLVTMPRDVDDDGRGLARTAYGAARRAAPQGPRRAARAPADRGAVRRRAPLVAPGLSFTVSR